MSYDDDLDRALQRHIDATTVPVAEDDDLVEDEERDMALIDAANEVEEDIDVDDWESRF